MTELPVVTIGCDEHDACEQGPCRLARPRKPRLPPGLHPLTWEPVQLKWRCPRCDRGLSPTARTLALVRKLGYRAQPVEKWNPHRRIRQDLFGFGDVLAIRAGRIWLIQACMTDDRGRRLTKLTTPEAEGGALEGVRDWIAAGGDASIVAWTRHVRQGRRTYRWSVSDTPLRSDGSRVLADGSREIRLERARKRAREEKARRRPCRSSGRPGGKARRVVPHPEPHGPGGWLFSTAGSIDRAASASPSPPFPSAPGNACPCADRSTGFRRRDTLVAPRRTAPESPASLATPRAAGGDEHGDEPQPHQRRQESRAHSFSFFAPSRSRLGLTSSGRLVIVALALLLPLPLFEHVGLPPAALPVGAPGPPVLPVLPSPADPPGALPEVPPAPPGQLFVWLMVVLEQLASRSPTTSTRR